MRKHYANPFMPTPAQIELKRAVTNYKIWFHLLEYGESVGDGFYSINKMAIAVRPALTGEDAEKLDEGIRIFSEATKYNAWRKSYTRPVEEAMDVILKRFPKLPHKVAVNAIRQALANSHEVVEIGPQTQTLTRARVLSTQKEMQHV